MFAQEYQSNKQSFCLYVKITCEGKKKFRVWAEETGKRNSKYADRQITVDGERTIHLSFPVSPKSLFIGVANCQNLKDTTFKVQLLQGPLIDYNIWLDDNTKSFLKLATTFSQVCGFEPGTHNGRIFTNKAKTFIIKYYDVIKDFKSGKRLNTPARIGHQTGKIDVAEVKFDKYTIPMRMMILLHEFSHKYKNPKIGLEIENEIGADINALYIYLGLGYSKIDAICVYANVFLKAQTKGNIERMRKIMDYIQKFENQEFAYRK
jgi:hypothetical protein